MFVVGGHGSPQSFVDVNRDSVTPTELSQMIKNHPKYKEGMHVYLLSCETGKGKNSYAEQLSREMNGPITAPNTLAWYWPDGKVKPYEATFKTDACGGMVTDQNGNLIKVPDYFKPGKYQTFGPKK